MIKNITIATASLSAIPLINQLSGETYHVRVILPKEYQMLKELFRKQNPDPDIEFAEEVVLFNETLSSDDLLIVMGYPKKIDTDNLAARKAINIHFGPLPENRGADPLFWTLKQGKRLAYITIHELSGRLDSGAVLLEKAVEIYPGESYGLLASRLGNRVDGREQ